MYVKKVKDLKRKMQNQNLKFKTYLVLGLSVGLCTFSFSFFAFAAEPNQLSAEVAGDPTPQIEQICSSIYKGDFLAARQILGGSTKSKSTTISQLINIVSEYEAMDARRRSTREQAYKEQLARLERFQAEADVNDVNDANNITSVLAVIAQVREFADEQQQLLSDSFVKRTIQRAKDKAAQYESEGNWLEAYITCYSWLQSIYPDDEAYSDYAERLVEKSGIVASFQDSPCESSEERFEGVREDILIWAIDVLSSNYVGIIDYRQMAIKAVKRCELLAEVMEKRVDGNDVEQMEKPNAIHYILSAEELGAWSAALGAVSDELNGRLGMSKDDFVDVFKKVLILNEATARLPREILVAQFAEAALSALDPYTVMIWPRRVPDFEKEMTNKFTGIGIEISRRKGLLTVSSLLLDTPAFESGLDAGDVIEAVDGVATKDMSIMCAVRRITGPAGTQVTLTVRRPGEVETRDISITRARIVVSTIRGWQRTERGRWRYMIDDAEKIGYIRIYHGFSESTARDLEKVLGELEREGLRGLVLDLRFNSGGLLDSAAKVVDKFVREGLIVITRPRSWVSSTYLSAHKKGTHPNYPLVILINSSSASASEIVAGALADEMHNRAILVGERTHGKGSVQGITRRRPGGGAQLKYTTAYYYLPSGKRVKSRDAVRKQGRKDWGVGPDIEIKLRSDELKKMIGVQRDNDVLVRAGHSSGTTGDGLKKHTAEETLASDQQFAVGVLVVKAKLVEAQGGG